MANGAGPHSHGKLDRMTYLWIALGGAAGSVLRYAASSAVANATGQTFLGTLVVNVTGSFVIGAIAAFQPGKVTEQLLMIGILGGYTTFSAFTLQTLQLMESGRWGVAVANILSSVLLGLVAVWLGYQAGMILRK